MSGVELKALAQTAGGDLIGQSVLIEGLAIDSRAVRKGDLFAAIRGARVDGHEFAASAMQAGAAALLTERRLEGLAPQLVVADVQRASGAFALLKRKLFNGPVVAITGSAGKTTTKNMVSAALSVAGSVHATQGNQNNELGVPLTLAGLDLQHQFAVIEMGAGQPGDIAYLCNLAEPDVSVCLNASAAHLAHFDSVDDIAHTKGEIFQGLRGQGLAVINADQPWLSQWIEQAGDARFVTFGLSAQADYRAVDLQSRGLAGTEFQLEAPGFRLPVRLALPGRQHVMNALAALAVAIELGVSPEGAIEALRPMQAGVGRGAVLSGRWGGRVIDDTYNANPAAVKAAIDVLAEESGHRVLILGAMLELGIGSETIHEEVGAYARSAGIEQLIAVGQEAEGAVVGFGESALFFADQASLESEFPALPADHVIWVKASRGAALEKTVGWLTSTEGSESC
jgi:UDP-N-acetylmuramoyl-tripeptide--D-alanyl-D-alanine ligase